jgi:hypothetical protein
MARQNRRRKATCRGEEFWLRMIEALSRLAQLALTIVLSIRR